MKAVTMGMPVFASDGRVGRIDDVLTSAESNQPAYLVIDAGGFFKGDVVVPYASVQNVDDSGVWLALTRDEVKGSPGYDAAQYGSAAGLVSHAAARYGED